MATIKKYNGSTWENAVVRKYGTASEIITPPTTIYADGTAISTYTIKGNTVQSGTPTPSAPLPVNGTGNKTANLLNQDESTQGDGYLADSVIGINNQGQPQTISTPNFFVTEYIPVSAGTYYYYSDLYRATGNSAKFMFYNANKEFIGYTERQPAMEEQPVYELSSFSAPANTAYMRMNIDKLSTKNCLYTSQLPSYEPYGQYKIPISNGQQTTNIYLGSTQSSRRIKKLVLDGTESYTVVSQVGGRYRYSLSIPLMSALETLPIYCTHFRTDYTIYELNNNTINNAVAAFRNALYFYTADYATDTDFKAYLAAQYAAGTPVTVWYILATAATATVNEPLMKIDTYADSISNAVSIPTTDGANTITVDTTVQPSEFTATWTGWHDSSVKEYDGSQWQ